MLLPLPLPPPRPFDVTAVGENSIDLVAVVDGHPAANSKVEMRDFARLPGGETATAAVALARVGRRVRYVGRVGDDEFGHLGLASLRDAGVEVGAVVVVPGATSRFAIILVDPAAGHRTVIWHLDPAVRLVPADVPDTALADARVVLLNSQDPPAMADIAERARRAGARTVLDVEQVRPEVERLLRATDVVIAADGFATAFTGVNAPGAALAALQDASGAAVVCVTLGEEGSLARAGGREIRTPAFPVEVVDPTGAGDAFRAGFIAGWLTLGETAPLEDVLRWANGMAALNCRALGARAGCPTTAEVLALLDRPM
ncbi:MAG: carbohydrate kinase family protein [Vicinamibacterales bacterium]